MSPFNPHTAEWLNLADLQLDFEKWLCYD